MTVNQVIQGLGSWNVRLRADAPRELLANLDYFGHVAILPGRVNPIEYGDNLLTSARYVGVHLGRDSRNEYELNGTGMGFWLGDSDDKGDVFETAVTLTNAGFGTAIAALMPDSGSVTVGTLYSVPGTYSGTHKWQTPRKAITYVTQVMGSEDAPVEWRVNGNATLDAGPIANLYRMDPAVLLVSRDAGRELARRAVAGRMSLDTDIEDYATRVIVLAEGEGDAIATGTANALSVPYRDMHGNTVVMKRLVSSAETTAGNADAVAQLQLNRFVNPRQAAKLATSDYFVAGDLVVGDYIAVYDPTNGYEDTNNESYWRGQPINPINLRCVELTWPVEAGWTVGFRDSLGVWYDLSDWYVPESGETNIVVGDFSRALSNMSTQPVGTRPVGDASVPDVPVFTGFSTGSYQSTDTNVTKAAIRAQWSTPLNTDGTTVVDGDHYEIRYRPNQFIGSHISWAELSTHSWGSLGAWGSPLTAPVTDSPDWVTAYVGWGSNAFTIQELTPGIQYELQIRAVDSANPPHQGAWSLSEFVLTVGDLVPPSPPGAPVVAGNLVAVQVVHQLGKASGGTFNLEPDLAYLDVHLGGSPSFYPDASNKIGSLIANDSMMRGEVPAIGSFTIDHVTQVHIKVVAVDQAGNRSEASEAATVTADLIDDAHISNLTVSKVTAGTISANWILGSSITTALEGQRVELGQFGLRGFNAQGARTIELDNGAAPSLTFYQGTGASDGFVYTVPPVKIGQLPGGLWGMQVRDLYDNIQVQVGQLVAGSTAPEDYGLAAVDPDTGNLVSLNALAFGMDAAFIEEQGICNTTAFGDLADDDDPAGVGPIVSVRVGTSGRCQVTVSCDMFYGGEDSISGGYMGFAISGATTRAADTQNALGRIDTIIASGATTVSFSSFDRRSFTCLVDGLTPGVNTFTAKYARNDSSYTWRAGARTIIVQPF